MLVTAESTASAMVVVVSVVARVATREKAVRCTIRVLKLIAGSMGAVTVELVSVNKATWGRAVIWIRVLELTAEGMELATMAHAHAMMVSLERLVVRSHNALLGPSSRRRNVNLLPLIVSTIGR
eukprot:SAG31_NODE_13464_length_867_cov_1.320312_2_plen_124_part_00